MMHSLSLLSLLLLMLSWRIQAYSSGAPASACQSMLPGHKSGGAPILAQNDGGGSVPFTVQTSKTAYAPGEMIEVTVEGIGGQGFRAFIIQARRADTSLNVVEPIGNFTIFNGAQAVCNQPTGAFGLTHTSEGVNILKTKQVFQWIAPGADLGHVKFRLTLAEAKAKFWTDVESDVVTDGSSPPLPTDTSTESPQVMKPIRQINTVNECGVVKGCYLSPADCVENKCEFLLTYQSEGEFIDFEMSAGTTGYVAVGFSNDDKMGKDSVIECIYDKDQNRVIIQHSYNENAGVNILVGNPYVGLYNMSGYYQNGRLSCRFRRRRSVDANVKNVFDLGQDYYLLMAKGATSKSVKYQHDLSSGTRVTPEKVNLANTASLSGSKRYPLAKAHGCMMVLAWVFCASFGMLLARYYKPMWPSQRICDEKVWFQIHRTLMISVSILSIISIILIVVMVGGYSYGLRDLPFSLHPILGIIVMCLAILNPTIAMFRPHPGTANRPIFNWCHWGIGTTAHVLSVPTIFIGLGLPKAHAHPAARWVLVAFVVIHCVCEIILEIHQCHTKRRNKEKNEEFELHRVNNPQESAKQIEPSGRFFKMIILGTHGVLVGGCAVVIILMIAGTIK